MSLEGVDVVVDGVTLNVQGEHTFNTLTLQNNAVLTHLVDANDRTVIHADTVVVDASSRIDVSGKGQLPSGDVGGYAGGSYGGLGGAYSTSTPNAPYGSYQNPTDLGMGGRQTN
ncbi:hypothetical protein, partial [Sedimenticola sp.]|uniref:hypothetical protein n=1 Tax=Sedimenticola sp. TaxID=1940285 RepID=UPI003D0ED2FF